MYHIVGDDTLVLEYRTRITWHGMHLLRGSEIRCKTEQQKKAEWECWTLFAIKMKASAGEAEGETLVTTACQGGR